MKTLTNEKSGRFFLYLLYLFSMPLFAQPQYQFIDLDALISNDSEYTKTGSVATVVNDLNHVAGWYLLDMPDQDRKKAIGFIYRPDSGVEEIVAPYDRSVKILDMNNNDQFIGKWISPFGDKSYFTHWQDFKNVDMLESVTKISDSGNVLGIINKTRGVLKSSVAILQRDNTVIDILQDAVDCDRFVMGDCDGDNRIDFDYWQKIAALDMNNQGQIVFALMRNTEPDSYTPRHEYKIYSYTQDMGIRFLKSEFFRRPARYPHGFFGQLQAISINEEGTVLIFSTETISSMLPSFSMHLYSIDGTDLTPKTILENLRPTGGRSSIRVPDYHTINNNNIIVGINASIFSLTDVSQTYRNRQFLFFPNSGEFYDYHFINDINNNNIIVGYSNKDYFEAYMNSEDYSKAFVFIPVILHAVTDADFENI